MSYTEHKDAAPDLAPEPRHQPRNERSLEMNDSDRPDPVHQIGLIRSIAAWAPGREDYALTEIRAVLAGADIDDLLDMRGA